MSAVSIVLRVAFVAAGALALAGCLAAAVGGAAVGAAGTAVGVTAKAASVTVRGVGKVAGAALPGHGGKD